MEYILLFTFWLGLTLIVGAIGSKRNIGIFFSVLWCFLLSPIIGLAITLFSKPKLDKDRVKESIINQLDRIDSLKEKGLINERQYESEKSSLSYRLKNINAITEVNRTPHYIGLLIYFLVIVLSIFAIRYYVQKNNISIISFSNSDSISNNNGSFVDNAINTFKSNDQEEKLTKISGTATYASDGIPDGINVYAINVETKKIYNHSFFNRDSGKFELDVPEGKYYIFSAFNSDGVDIDEKKTVNIISGKKYVNLIADDISITPIKEDNENKFLNKYFYVCTSQNKDFDNFFDLEVNKYDAFYFKDESTVIHYVNINGWQEAGKGIYKIENNQLILKVPSFFSGSNTTFGGNIDFENERDVILWVNGVNSRIDKLKMSGFFPEN